MNTKLFKDDLTFLVDKIKNVHISTISGFTEAQSKLIKSSFEILEDISNLNQFYFLANNLIMTLNDSHSRLSLPFENHTNFIPLDCLWLNDGIFVLKDFGMFKSHDRIKKIGGHTEAELLAMLKEIIPNENDYLIRAMAFEPYDQSRFLFSELLLEKLGLIDNDHVEFEVLRNGKSYTFYTELQPYNQSDSKDSPFISYEIHKESSLGVLRLDECIFNEVFKNTIEKFFHEISLNDIHNIALDLRRNMGGDTRVILEFIKYIDVDKYYFYTMDERISSEAIEKYRQYFGREYADSLLKQNKSLIHESHKDNLISNTKINDTNLLFQGDLFILTSSMTYSSARTFAVIFKDNDLATIVGEPTGGKPSSYGNVLRFRMPNSKIKFSISTKYFQRPCKDINQDSLYPDILVHPSIDHIINGIDSTISKLKHLL